MLENLRFYKGEKENSKDFAKKLAAAIKQNASSETSKKTARIKACYVNDAFSVSHRRHASVSSIKQYLPAFAGLLLENEIINLNKALKPKKPAVAVMGGAKISTKIRLIKKLQASYSNILIGGAMANNFFKAKGLEVGKSLVSDDDIELAKKIRSNKVILPIDCVVGSGASGKKIALKKIGEVSKKDAIYDIGPETLKLYAKYLNQAKTIIWNGPMGMFENKRFRTGSITIARLISTLSSGKAFGVVGGGETIEALKLAKDFHYVDWVSTGGGAMLAYLGGEEMPGLERLIK